mmetsp:Transcript_2716/g.5335  ORF Transcript_2716/g.5335 Transcript_2716/m.5335 type:complete len:210 (-) Transcript_2716:434-1063(-)
MFLNLFVNILFQLCIRGLDAELLLASNAHNSNRVPRLMAAAVRLDCDCLAFLGLHRETCLGEISEGLPRRSLEGEAICEFSVWRHCFYVVDSDIIEGRKEGKLVDSHVLQHALCIAFEALRQFSLLVSIVVDECCRCPRSLSLELESLGHVRRHVLVVAHVNRYALALRILSHLFELFHSGCTWFFKIYMSDACINQLLEQAWVVGSTS